MSRIIKTQAKKLSRVLKYSRFVKGPEPNWNEASLTCQYMNGMFIYIYMLLVVKSIVLIIS